MPRARTKDLKNWISELKQCGITKFIFSELPTALQVRMFLRKAREGGFLKRSGRIEKNKCSDMGSYLKYIPITNTITTINISLL